MWQEMRNHPKPPRKDLSQWYAHLLLAMASVADESRGRLRRHALAMAAGWRIDSLLQEGRTFSRRLTWTGSAAVLLCGIPLVWGAGAVELDPQQPPAAVRPKFEVASIRPCRPGESSGGKTGKGGGRGPTDSSSSIAWSGPRKISLMPKVSPA